MLQLLRILAASVVASASPAPAPTPLQDDVTHDVSCDDPLEKAPDCERKARETCHGAFDIVRQTEGGEPPAAGIAPPYRESRGYLKRVLTFRCHGTSAPTP